MNASALTTPVLLIVYRRPDTTRRVFETIRSVRPKALYVAADGPRPDLPGEAEDCAQVRQLATSVDWDCDLHTLFRDQNLGCGLGASSGITWFFDNVQEGIVLEDDCVPGPSFYRFAQELLVRYRDASRVMHIGGNSFQFGRRRGAASYYFSKYAHIWGWASWSRAWRDFDFTLAPEALRHDVWDAQWQRSMERAGGIAIVPNANLVSNIGFGPAGTNTLQASRLSAVPAVALEFPLRHPQRVQVDRTADAFSFYVHHRNVRHMNWIWAYQFWDLARGIMKALKRRVLQSAGKTPLGNGS